MILTFALAFIAGLNSFARPGRLDAIASLNAFAGLDPLDTSTSRIALNAFAGLNALDALARLDTRNGFAGLVSLHALYTRDALGARARLNPLNAPAGLNALASSCAHITELLLKVCVSESDVAVMSRVEPPVLKLAGTGNVDVASVKSTVKSGVGLDRCVAWVSPVVVVPQRRPDEERRTETECRPDCPPAWIPEERHICRRPIIGTVDNHRIIDRNIDIVRFDWFDYDVLGRSCIPGAWRRSDPADLLFLARLQTTGRLCLFAQCLNRILYIVGLSQKGLAELVGPVQLLVHHREHLRNRRQSLDAWIPLLLLHCIFESRVFEVWILLGPTRRHRHFKRIGRRSQHLRQ